MSFTYLLIVVSFATTLLFHAILVEPKNKNKNSVSNPIKEFKSNTDKILNSFSPY